jgi:hypothetical protein
MRLITLSKLLALGGAAVWAYKHRQRFMRGAPGGVTAADLRPDPSDPVQGFHEAPRFSDLDVDVLDHADAEAAQDLAMLESELDESALEIDTPSQTTLDAQDIAVEDTGELYGVHTPRAVDRDLPDDSQAMAEGQNWIEALETSAVEYGAAPEQDVDVTDDQDEPPHASDTRDTPVADHGSGGPGGV